MKKLVALLLCLAILLSLGSVAAASPKVSLTDAALLTAAAITMTKLVKNHLLPAVDRYVNGINYVALGDSTTVGFYLGDYTYSHQHNGKYPVSGEFSEYALFMDYLTKKYSKVTGTDLTMTGMRPIFLRGILSDCEFQKIANRSEAIFDEGFASHIGFTDGEYKDGGEYCNADVAASLNIQNAYNGLSGNADSMREIFTTALKNANIISYDMLMIDTSINTLAAFSSMNSTEATNKFATLMKEENYSGVALGANALRLALQPLLAQSALSAGLITVNNVIDALLFIYADLVINFSKNMEWIYKNNKNNPTVIVVMPTNYFPKVDVQIGGATISLTRLMDCLLDAVNAYLIKGCPYADRYVLADSSNANETCIAAYGQGVFNTDHAEYPDYANLWYVTENYLMNQKLAELTAPTTFAGLTAAEQSQVKANFAAACDSVYNPKNHLLINLSDIGLTISDNPNNALFDGIDRTFYKTASHTDIINYSQDDNPVTGADQCALVLALGDILLMGIHPSAQCCVNKADAITAAYESSRPARSFYCTRLTDFARNSVGAVLGSQKSQAAVSKTLSRWFTPIVDLSGLLKKTG